MRLRHTLAAAAIAALVAACGDDNLLADPTRENVVDTITLGALLSTPVTVPSACAIDFDASLCALRTSETADYDFAYDIDSVLGPVFLPAEVTGVLLPASANPGLQQMALPFDSISAARSNGYINDAAIPIDSGDVLLGRSKIRCNIGLPLYAKLEVLSFDTAAHTVTFQIMVDRNCGYRGLEPGLPGS